MKDEKLLLRKKSVSNFFLEFSKWHRLFLKELAEKGREHVSFPPIPIRELAMCYDDVLDMEVAAFAGLLINDGKRAEKNIREFRVMMGSSPWRWFWSRGFVMLSTGDSQNKRTGGILNWRITEFFDKLHDCYKQGLDCRAMLNVVESDESKKRLLLMVLGTRVGLGLGVWPIDDRTLLCPDTHEMRVFLHHWMPDFSLVGRTLMQFDESVRLFGFERDVDFFYAYLGWKELCRRNPKRCSRYVTVYQNRYKGCLLLEKRYWIDGCFAVVPKIDF